MNIASDAGFLGPRSLLDIFKKEWKLCFIGAIFSFFLASLLMSGWPAGVIPNIKYPYTYGGDGLFQLWYIQRLIEGWVYNNLRLGYPFGSSSFDYPGSDFGNYLIQKIIGLITRRNYSTLNLYFLLSFPISFVFSFLVTRALRVNIWFSITATALFVFLPFHFLRLPHLFYTWYFVVPLAFYLGYSIYDLTYKKWKTSKISWLIGGAIISLILSSFGVYYAVFSVIVIAIAGICGGMRNKSIYSPLVAFLAISILSFGVLLNLMPNLINNHKNGENTVMRRAPAESDLYSLRLPQLIFPSFNHRLKYLSDFRKNYDASMKATTLSPEGWSAYLGVIGVLGFFIILGSFFVSAAGRKVDSRLRFLAITTATLLLFGNVGGFGGLFAFFISPEIRAWARISIFIGFGSMMAFFIALQLFIKKYFYAIRIKHLLVPFIAGLILLVGLYDETVDSCPACNAATAAAFDMDRSFIEMIENLLPKGSAIYQLPYMAFPESAHINSLGGYQLGIGFLHSKYLYWTYGGMRERPGDLFYRALAKEPIEKQIEIVRKLGFAGVYVDKRGYTEADAQNLIASITTLLGPPKLMRADGQIVFFQIVPIQKIDFSGLTPKQIMDKVGYGTNV